MLKRPWINSLESIHQKVAHQERSSGHITAFSEEDTGFIGRKKSIHNLLTEGFSVCSHGGLLYLSLSGYVYHDAVLLNDLL